MPSSSARRAGRAAAAWAILFALLSLYWALGGTAGGGTLGVELERLAIERDPSVVAALWASVVLKLACAGIVLALVESWGPRRLLLALVWLAGAGMTLYGLANLVQHALMATGAIATPAGLGSAAVPWHLALWDPIWIIGGVLFLTTALLTGRAYHGSQAASTM